MQWDPSLECGVELIDNEHRELVRLVGDLIQAAKNRKAVESSKGALDFLGKYVTTHFEHEEIYMKKCSYPETSEHKRLHAEFVKTFLDLKKHYDENGENLAIALEINTVASNWLINHIKAVDKKFAQYYKEHTM